MCNVPNKAIAQGKGIQRGIVFGRVMVVLSNHPIVNPDLESPDALKTVQTSISDKVIYNAHSPSSQFDESVV
ncbi:MAG: hypothetical protein F6K09_27760 [Merismopedia sp. SIO2A8]|nr:hypothetical protein [Symploca sp. SIO2B6]NET52347.1 hypothetical protein [Merismopedia sp. SIO2A8]